MTYLGMFSASASVGKEQVEELMKYSHLLIPSSYGFYIREMMMIENVRLNLSPSPSCPMYSVSVIPRA